jgi:hypothetical protein
MSSDHEQPAWVGWHHHPGGRWTQLTEAPTEAEALARLLDTAERPDAQAQHGATPTGLSGTSRKRAV